MKYEKGNLVKIKSMSWWNELEKDDEGDGICIDNGDEPVYFLKHIADACCGKIGEICSIKQDTSFLPYLVKFPNKDGCWFTEDWIESKVERIITSLKQIKNEI